MERTKREERILHIHTRLSRLLINKNNAMAKLQALNMGNYHGGISTSELTLNWIYESSPNYTLPELFRDIFRNPLFITEERFLPDGEERAPDAVATGRILDIMEILDPGKIGYTNTVRLLIGTMDDLTIESEARHRFLGEEFVNYHSMMAWILQNSILCDDPLIRRDKTQQLFNAYLQNADEKQRVAFNQGQVDYLEAFDYQVIQGKPPSTGQKSRRIV